MLNPICVGCKAQMQLDKSSFRVRDQAIGRFPPTIWYGEKFVCPKCQQAVVINCGNGAVYQDGQKVDLEFEY